jgi:hypothetical protein
MSFLTTEKNFVYQIAIAPFFCVLILPFSGCPIFFLVGRRTLNPLDFACFLSLPNMSQNDLVQPVAAAATTQVKLCTYDEEEPHIWFNLIEAQFTTVVIKSQRLKYANALASLPKQVLGDIPERGSAWTVWKEQVAVLFLFTLAPHGNAGPQVQHSHGKTQTTSPSWS